MLVFVTDLGTDIKSSKVAHVIVAVLSEKVIKVCAVQQILLPFLSTFVLGAKETN